MFEENYMKLLRHIIGDGLVDKIKAPFPEVKEKIDAVLKTLRDREEKIIKLRYGIDTDHSHSLDEIGGIFCITRERVQQVEAKAIRECQSPNQKSYLIGSLKLEDFAR